MLSFGIRKEAHESWRECVQRYGERYALVHEVLEAYDTLVSWGVPRDVAALDACVDWDVVELFDEATDGG